MRLSKDDIALLRWLENHQSTENQSQQAGHSHHQGATSSAESELPRIFFETNLVQRLPSGQLHLTKTGERALFQAECIEALDQALAGRQTVMAGGVERWLVSSGFLHAVERSVTSRGKLWLASLSPAQASGNADEPCAPQDTPSAETFAARRAAG